MSRSPSPPSTERVFWDPRAKVAVAAPSAPSLHPKVGETLHRLLDEMSTRNHADGPQPRIGVSIVGPEGYGKSSLAARVTEELDRPTAVLGGPFSFRGLMRALLSRLRPAALSHWRTFELSPVPPDEQEDFLVEIFDRFVPDAGLILVLDGLEKLLRTSDPEPRRPAPRMAPLLVDLIRAVRRSTAAVTLVVTTRRRFTLPDRGQDLADTFAVLPLDLPEEPADPPTVDLGHPGLRDRLRRVAEVLPASHTEALRPMQAYLQGRRSISKEEIPQVAAFFESLLFERLQQDMSLASRDLLRISTIFETPVPWALIEELAERFDLLAGLRQNGHAGPPQDSPLVRLGFWTLLPTSDGEMRIALDPAAVDHAGHLDDEERPAVAMHLLQLIESSPSLGGEPEVDLQRCRLAVAAMDPEILNQVLPGALDALLMDQRRDHALELAKQALYLMDTSRFVPQVEALRRAGDLLSTSDDPAKGAALLRRADGATETDEIERAAVLRSYGRVAVLEGDLDVAVGRLENAARTFADLGRPWDAAMTLDEVAGARCAGGDLEGALKARNEELTLLQGLTAERRKVTVLGHLGTLAGALERHEEALDFHRRALDVAASLPRAESLRHSVIGEIAESEAALGRFDEAMALHRDRLRYFDGAKDPRGRADALWAAARIELRRSRIDSAMVFLVEAYHLSLEANYVAGVGRVGLDYGQVLWAAGMMGEARLILEKAVESFRRIGAGPQLADAQAILEELTTAS